MENYIAQAISHGKWELIAIAILLLIVIVLITKPDTADKWRTQFYSLFAWCSTLFQKNKIKSQVQGFLNPTIKALENEIDESSRTRINIKWAKSNEVEKYLDNGDLIVCLQNHRNRNRNIATITSLYVSDHVMKGYKSFLEPTLGKIIKNYTIAKLLKFAKDDNAYNYFIENEQLLKSQDPTGETLYRKCNEIDNSGNFTRILLRQYKRFGIYNDGVVVPTSDILKELGDFFDFVYNLSTKAPGTDTPLAYKRKYINCAVVLVAKSETFDQHGIDAYLWRIKFNISCGYQVTYLQSRDGKVDILNKVVKEIDKFEEIQVVQLPEFRHVNNGKPSTVVTYLVLSLMANTLEAVKLFRNVDDVDEARTLFSFYDNVDHANYDVADPTSGFELTKLTTYFNEHFISYRNLATNENYNGIPIDQCASISLSDLQLICNAIGQEDFDLFTESTKYVGHFYRTRKYDDTRVLDLLIRLDSFFRCYFGISHGNALDSICIDIYKEAEGS